MRCCSMIWKILLTAAIGSVLPGRRTTLFWAAGTLQMQDAVGVFPLRDTRDQAVVSANAARVARIETGGGLIEMDSEQPFVLLLPWESEFDFYDAEGNPVTTGGHVW